MTQRTAAKEGRLSKSLDYEQSPFSLRDSRTSVKITPREKGETRRGDSYALREQRTRSKAWALQSLIFLSPRRVSPFSRGGIFTCARFSLALISLRKNGDYLQSSKCAIRDFGQTFGNPKINHYGLVSQGCSQTAERQNKRFLVNRVFQSRHPDPNLRSVPSRMQGILSIPNLASIKFA